MTMDCRFLNENTYNRIKNFLEKSRTEENDQQETYFRSTYSPGRVICKTLKIQ